MASLRLVIAVSLATVLLALPSTAGAIVGGQPDTQASHSYVVFVGQLGAPRNACTGILVNATTVVTAAHCGTLENGTTPANQPFIVFQGPNFRSPTAASPGLFVPHPEFSWGGDGLPDFAANDIAVIRLMAPLPGPYATLPRLGSLDALSPRSNAEIVGYGVQEFATGHTPIIDPRTGQIVDYSNGRTPLRTNGSRARGDAKLAGPGALGDEFVKIVSDACLGDSGGPVIVDGVSVAVLSFAPSACSSVTYATRLDTTAARTFLAGFGVSLP
jgi:trypsin